MKTQEGMDNTQSKILVADNFHVLRVMIKKFLEEEYQVIEAETGKDVLSMVEQHICEKSLAKGASSHKAGNVLMVLLSIEFPDLSGFEAAAILRKKYDKKSLPIIMNTSNNKRENILKAMEIGFNDYIVKPFSKELLLSKIHKLERDIPVHDLKLSKIISKIPFFHGVPESQVAYALHACSETITKKKGEVICAQKEKNHDIFILMKGECDVIYNNKKISVIKHVDTIGEIGFLEEKKRSATVIAAKPSEIIVLKKEPFENFLNEDRAISEIIYKNVIHTLSERIRKSNILIEELKGIKNENLLY